MERDEIFDEDGALSRGFLLARGYCCGNGCRNCPYEPRHGGPSAKVPNEGSGPLPGPEILSRTSA